MSDHRVGCPPLAAFLARYLISHPALDREDRGPLGLRVDDLVARITALILRHVSSPLVPFLTQPCVRNREIACPRTRLTGACFLGSAIVSC